MRYGMKCSQLLLLDRGRRKLLDHTASNQWEAVEDDVCEDETKNNADVLSLL